MNAGSVFFWILAAMGAAAAVMFVERLVELRRSQIDWQAFLKGVSNVLATGNEEEALAICEDTPVPVANVAAAAIRHRRGPAQALKEAVEAQTRSEIGRLDRRLASLGAIAQISPLVGLLGTIAGFIKTMTVLSSGPVVPRQELLSSAVGSMGVAAAGLAVAIPATAMYIALRARLARIVSDLESAAAEIESGVALREAAE